jgi:hypothetical protein
MTVMVPNFFGVPTASLRGGKFKDLSGIATKVYMALCHESERYSTRELTRTVAQLQELVAGSPNSHAKARAELMQAGLVQAEPYGTDGFVFVLCDPETSQPWPLHPKERAVYQRKGAPPVAVPLDATSHVKQVKPPKIDSAGVSFPFGANSQKQSSTTHKTVEPAPPLAAPSLSWGEIGNAAK